MVTMAIDTQDVLEPTLREVLDTKSLKWIFVGGKGGVGKTTTSCSLAVQLAHCRESVLIVSTDPAHNIGDAFGQKFSGSPQLVNGFANLYAMEVSSSEARLPFLKKKSDQQGGDDLGLGQLLPDLLNAFPGIDEALSFAELMNAIRSMSYSTIVFDTAPTGHTMRLIGFPDLLERGLNKLSDLRDQFSGAFNMANAMAGAQIDENELYQKLDSFKALTSSVKANFQDPLSTTFICVCIPEFLSVYETERLVQALAKHQMDCSNIVVNQVLFPIDISLLEDESSADNSSPVERQLREQLRLAHHKIELLQESVDSRRVMQSKYLRQVQELYGEDFHVVPMPIQPREIRGVDLLLRFGKLLCTPKKLPILEANPAT